MGKYSPFCHALRVLRDVPPTQWVCHPTETLVARRDARRDGFVRVIEKAMRQKLGDDADGVLKALAHHGIPRGLAKEATELAREQGRFTIFALVDALTRLTAKVQWVGDRTELDAKVATLLALAA